MSAGEILIGLYDFPRQYAKRAGNNCNFQHVKQNVLLAMKARQRVTALGVSTWVGLYRLCMLAARALCFPKPLYFVVPLLPS